MYWIIYYGDEYRELVIIKTKDRDHALKMADIGDVKFHCRMLCTSDLLCLTTNTEVLIRF